MFVFLVLSGLLASVVGEDYAGARVLSVQRESLVDEAIRIQGLDIWRKNSSHVDVFVPANKLSAFNEVLQSFAIPAEVKLADVQEAIKAVNPPESRLRSNRDAGMSWDRYQRLSVIHNYLDELARANPSFVSVGVLGYSHEKRPLKYIKISSGNPNAKIVFIDGGIHAREWISPATVTWAIKELVNGRNRLPRELRDVDWYVLPVINPDGYEYTHTTDRMWRKNRRPGRCVGVDLNRNFDIHWAGQGTSMQPCSEIYVGPGPASEPETKALVSFLSGIRNRLVAYLTFHNYSQMILIPYAHAPGQKAENFSELEAVGRRAAAAMRAVGGENYKVGNTVDLLSAGAGGSDDWAKAVLKTPFAYCIELRDTGDYGFMLPAKFIQPTGQEAFEAIKVIASAAAKSK